MGAKDFAAGTHHWERVRALIRELPRDPEVVLLGLDACRQLIALGWRSGMELEEMSRLLDEGQALADAIGDRSAHLLLAVVFSRGVGAMGDAATYLKLARENERAARELGDETVHAVATQGLVDALCFANRFDEALQWADASLARFPRRLPAAEAILGFDFRFSLMMWRGWCLTWTGQLADGLEALARGRQLSEESGSLERQGYALGFIAEALYFAHAGDRALASARQAEDASRAQGDPPSQAAFAQLALAYAHLAAGRASAAIEPARASLELHGRVNKGNLYRSATVLAEALLAAGDLSAAQSAADEAVAICRRMLGGAYEALAHGVLARVLLRRDGAAARDAIEAELASAAELIERTGARTLEPALCEWRAELAAALGDSAARARLLGEAERGYREIGAPLQAERIAHLMLEAQ